MPGSNHRSFTATVLVVVAVVCVTAFYKFEIPAINNTTIALTYLLVSLVAGTYGLAPGLLASILCGICFNFFFLPPVGTLTVQDPQNWVALTVFLITALTANHLSSAARRRSEESERRRSELSKLYEVSRAIILTPNPEQAVALLTHQVREIFSLHTCLIVIPESSGKRRILASAAKDPDAARKLARESNLQEVFESGKLKQVKDDIDHIVTYAPLKSDLRVMGALICVSEKSEPATMEALAGLAALALERARFLTELSHTEALKQSDQLKSAILASVSHDLRTPLTSILAAVDNLLSTDVDWDEAARKEFYTIIKEEVDRLSRLVQNLLEMARIEAGECRPVKDWGSVPEMIGEVLERSSESLSNHQIKLEVQENIPMVRWDERLMAQVLVYLLENAANYSPAGTEIALGAQIKDHTLFLRVQDQGPGISPEEILHIFDRFYRGRASSRDHAGTGMGLAIARGITEAHGGILRVESTTGQGATFIMEIPVETKATK